MSESLQDELFKAIQSDNVVMVSLTESSKHAEPMYAHVEKQNSRELWFYMSKDNRVASGGHAMIQFVSKEHKIFSCMHGRLIEERRSEFVDKFWSNQIEAWFDGGKDDTNLLMMRFEFMDGEVWKNDPTVKGFIKLILGKNVESDEMGDHEVLELTK